VDCAHAETVSRDARCRTAGLACTCVRRHTKPWGGFERKLVVRRSKFHALTFFTLFNVFQRFFSRLRVPLHSVGASELLPPNYFQSACKDRKLVSAKGRASRGLQSRRRRRQLISTHSLYVRSYLCAHRRTFHLSFRSLRPQAFEGRGPIRWPGTRCPHHPLI
jgi:hypothetical protein